MAYATTNQNYGVWGESRSTAGRGVHGEASASTGTTTGVYGMPKEMGLDFQGGEQ